MTRILVTGASGLLGSNLSLMASPSFEVVGQYYQHAVELPGVRMLQADLTDRSSVQSLFERAEPDWVVHAAAATDLDRCEADPDWARQLNRDAAAYVAERAMGAGARLAHISTDAVFDGVHGWYREEDSVNPISVYGETKRQAERAVRDAHLGALILRTNFFGWNARDKKSLGEWFLGHLEAGRECSGFEDVYITTLLVNDLASYLLRMLDHGLSGLFHLAGGECVSKYQFGRRLAETFHLDPSLIKPISVEELGLKARRAKQLCLESKKVERALGEHVPSLDESLAYFKELRGKPFYRELVGGAR